METIQVVSADSNENDQKILGILDSGISIREIDVNVLRSSISKLSNKISEILQDIKTVGDFRLKEVKISVEVNTEGGVVLVGSLKGGAKGAITLKFTV